MTSASRATQTQRNSTSLLDSQKYKFVCWYQYLLRIEQDSSVTVQQHFHNYHQQKHFSGVALGSPEELSYRLQFYEHLSLVPRPHPFLKGNRAWWEVVQLKCVFTLGHKKVRRQSDHSIKISVSEAHVRQLFVTTRIDGMCTVVHMAPWQ